MSFKIADPDESQQNPESSIAGGSFEFYQSGTKMRRYAYTDAIVSSRAPFQNSLNENGVPIAHLWVDSIAALDVVIRNIAGAILFSGPLSDYLTMLNPGGGGGGANQAEVTAAIAGSFNQYTKANVPTI